MDSLLSYEESARDLEAEVERRKSSKKDDRFTFDMTPKELYAILNKSVIDQEEAKQQLSNAICYHYQGIASGVRKRNTHKNNVLLIGPTGCGKTFLVQKVAEAVSVPLSISDATNFSATGYVGENVTQLVQDLLSKTEGDLNAASRGIIYLDEIDKIAAKETVGKDVNGKEVQSGLLKIVEGGSEVKVATPYGERLMKTDNILFIAGGAFSDLYKQLRCSSTADPGRKKDLNDGEALYNADAPQLLKSLQKYGIIPELLGRIPVVARLRSLTKSDLKKILTDSDASVVRQYETDFASYGTTVKFDDTAYEAIAERAYQRGMGARALGAVLEEALTPLKFHLPGTGIQEVAVTAETIANPLEATLHLIQHYKGKHEGGTEK